MNPIPKIFNSKLLLFGEYGLLFDAMALSVPFSRFYGSLEFDTDALHKDSTREIRKFFQTLISLKEDKLHYPIDLNRLERDLDKGLYFQSNIPFQYGLGSSGALIAALFSRYKATSLEKGQLSILSLKENLGLLESYFHGKSSGLDPLVSFLNQPLLLGADKTIQLLDFNISQTGWTTALIDTQTSGATGPLVKHFMECMTLPDFKTRFYSDYVPANNGCIQALLKNDSSLFFSSFEQLIAFELDNLKPMFPLNFSILVKEAIKEKVFIKLLGSGGGGYLLAFAANENTLKQWVDRKDVQLIWVSSIP